MLFKNESAIMIKYAQSTKNIGCSSVVLTQISLFSNNEDNLQKKKIYKKYHCRAIAGTGVI